jgi:PKHD-type hydroxylase
MTNFMFAPMPPTEAENSLWVDWGGNGFSEEELILLDKYCGDNLTLTKGNIKGNEEGNDVSRMRRSMIGRLEFNDQTSWCFERIAWIARNINAQFYKFDLYGFMEPFQVAIYSEEDNGHYDWHIDCAPGTPANRKLSLVLQLSGPDEYDGGDLQINVGGEPRVITKSRGIVTAFPSFRLHRVTPVTRGIRRSVAIWVSGPPFR